MSESYLCISDLQIPFNHPKALQFCTYLKRHYKIKDQNCLCVGDEIDSYYGSLHNKDPDADLTANTEIMKTVEVLNKWYEAFPEMKLVTSNHGTRWQKRFFEAGIPSILMRQYRDWLQAPPGWKWQDKWLIQAKEPFIIEHGDNWGGLKPHIDATLYNGINTVMGHHHTKANIDHFRTMNKNYWAAVIGCLIDFPAYAFHYARKYKLKPALGALLVLNDGKLPVWIPLD